MADIQQIRKHLDEINLQILALLSKRRDLVKQIQEPKIETAHSSCDSQHEYEMMQGLQDAKAEPYPAHAIQEIFKTIFEDSFALQEEIVKRQLLVSREFGQNPAAIQIGDVTIAGHKDTGKPVVIAGPCAIESHEQLHIIAKEIKAQNVKILRGGAYKPRTSPYSFQGLGEEGLKYIHEITRALGLVSVVEIMDTRDIDLMCRYVDILQIGSRNMDNYALLKAASDTGKPILLKRGFMATIQEFLFAAEYLLLGGNPNVILCERGIRTFEPWTRSTLDLSAVAILKQETHLPVIVDISHSAGRRDIYLPLAKASLAVGADGIMVEVHNAPDQALSDAEQQLDFSSFRELIASLPR